MDVRSLESGELKFGDSIEDRQTSPQQSAINERLVRWAMWEQVGLVLLIAGGILSLAGSVMLIVAAFRTRWTWGLGVLTVIGAPFFLIRHWQRGRLSLAIGLTGIVLSALPIASSLIYGRFHSFGPHETIVDGERHVTLTGWSYPAERYALLASRPDTVVLQMANKDVTDETLKYVSQLKNLRELDLSESSISDDGLAVIMSLPKLTSLRVSGTAITDAGFSTHIAPAKGLLKLDVQRTKISGKLLRGWKNENSDRSYLK